ncbi:hypothetical protein [Sinomonas sp. G460-2]|uniref:hypothetical protein n=1 Tax=Sinomonas sp. G460-2 TaxID=3393464 RepID=UPI0039EF401D
MAIRRYHPRWHSWVGLGLVLAGAALGFTLPAGTGCGPAFPTAYGPVAVGQVTPPASDVAAACHSAALDLTHVFGGMIVLGIALIVLGAVLRLVVVLLHRRSRDAEARP